MCQDRANGRVTRVIELSLGGSSELKMGERYIAGARSLGVAVWDKKFTSVVIPGGETLKGFVCSTISQTRAHPAPY